MSVTLSEVKRAAKARRAPLAGESAGYLVLAVADQVLSAPRLVNAADIHLTEDGALRVLSGSASSDADAELSLRRALDQLLMVASSGSAALARASRRATPIGLAGLVAELEAALIPVNRSAARRALARLHRETARALGSGLLPAADPEPAAEPKLPLATLTPAAPPTAVALAEIAPVAAVSVAAVSVEAASEVTPIRVVPVAVVPVEVVPVEVAPVEVVLDEKHWSGVLAALSEELPAPAELQESDARTLAIAVRPIVAQPAPGAEPDIDIDVDIDVDVELEAEAVESDAAPTVMRAVEVSPVVLGANEESDLAPSEFPPDARTRPEPAILRKSLRDLLPLELRSSLVAPPPNSGFLSNTPALGSLAAELPVLDAAQLVQLAGDSDSNERAPDLTVVTSAPVFESLTEPMPEVAPLSPGVAIVASKKSDLTELVSSFQVAAMASDLPGEGDSQGLRRAIKEMAELDLTPAPFAALVR